MKIYLWLASVTIMTAACSGNKEFTDKDNETTNTIPVLRLGHVDTNIIQQYVADIQASKNVEIRARVQGYIDEIFVDEGQEVKKGQPLFSINNAEFKNELSKATAALLNATAEAKAAELELTRVKLLVDKKVIAKTEYELAEARLRSAEAKIAEARSQEENAKIRLSYTFIRSPFNGIIDRIPFKPGSLVDEGALLTTISDLNSMYAYFSVSESEYLRYLRAKGTDSLSGLDCIHLMLADGTRFPYTGKVETTESEIDSHTGSIAFRARFPNPDKLLKHGATGRILFETPANKVLMVPQKSVLEIQDKSFVYVVGNDNKVKMRSFVPQAKVNDCIIVQSGLSENETIVYEGLQSIREGAEITPQYIEPGNITSSVSFRQ